MEFGGGRWYARNSTMQEEHLRILSRTCQRHSRRGLWDAIAIMNALLGTLAHLDSRRAPRERGLRRGDNNEAGSTNKWQQTPRQGRRRTDGGLPEHWGVRERGLLNTGSGANLQNHGACSAQPTRILVRQLPPSGRAAL